MEVVLWWLIVGFAASGWIVALWQLARVREARDAHDRLRQELATQDRSRPRHRTMWD